MRRQVAVLGLGRFGQAVARELTRRGHDVLAVDSNERIVQAVSRDVTQAVQADFTDESVLLELGLRRFDTVIVAVSTNLEASVLTTVLLRRLGVQHVLAKAANELHGSILEQLGVSRVVYVEAEMGMRLAHSFAAPGVLDYLDVGPDYGIARVPVPDPLAGSPLSALELQKTYGLALVALLRDGAVTLNPPASEILKPTDELIVAGLDEHLERFPADRRQWQTPRTVPE